MTLLRINAETTGLYKKKKKVGVGDECLYLKLTF